MTHGILSHLDSCHTSIYCLENKLSFSTLLLYWQLPCHPWCGNRWKLGGLGSPADRWLRLLELWIPVNPI